MEDYLCLKPWGACLLDFLSVQPGGALPSTITPQLEKTKTPAAASAAKGKAARGKKAKAVKAKAEPPEETDPRKLELLNWVQILWCTDDTVSWHDKITLTAVMTLQ